MWTELEERGRREIEGFGLDPQEIILRAPADMRYVRQEHAVTVRSQPHLAGEDDRDADEAAFDEAHEHALQPLRARRGVGRAGEPAGGRHRRASSKPPLPARRAGRARRRRRRRGQPPRLRRRARAGRSGRRTRGRRCSTGNRSAGPAADRRAGTTTVVEPGDRCASTDYGNLQSNRPVLESSMSIDEGPATRTRPTLSTRSRRRSCAARWSPSPTR